jgi:hypothetical protein
MLDAELERLEWSGCPIDQVAQGSLASPRGLWHPESPKAVCHELILAARSLSYRITRIDLQRAWEEERREYQREAQG